MHSPHATAPATSARPTAHTGQPLQRLEDHALLSGRGAYADDLGTTPGTLHAAVLRSPHPHAELLAIDPRAALALPGVRAVLTGEEVQRWSQPFVVGLKTAGGQPMQHWALAIDRVRYVGEPVAVVVADNRYVAEDALDLVRVDYRPLDPVVDIEAALHPDSAVLHEAVGSNVVSDRRFRYGEPDAAFAAAAHRVATTVHYPRNSCTPIECGVVIAEWQSGGEGDEAYEVTSNFMGPFSLHAVMALALKLPGNKLRHKRAARLGRQLRRQAGGVSVRGADVPGLAPGRRPGQVGGRPAGAPECRHLGHRPADHPRGRGGARGPHHRAALGPGRRGGRLPARARAGHLLPHARLPDRRLRHPPPERAQPRRADATRRPPAWCAASAGRRCTSRWNG